MGRCVDCKFADIYGGRSDYTVFFTCVRSLCPIDSPRKIDFLQKHPADTIQKRLRKPCDLILINGEYGFEPLEEEE